eukprot:213217_1
MKLNMANITSNKHSDPSTVSKPDDHDVSATGSLSKERPKEKTWTDAQGRLVERVDENGDVLKTILLEGSGEKPPVMSRVHVHIKVSHGEEVYVSKTHEEFDFMLGKAETCKGVEMAVATMRAGERARIQIGPTFGYSDLRRPKGMPADLERFEAEVELLRFEKEKNLWDLNDDEKMELAKSKRETGNQMYRDTKFKTAVRSYEKAIQYLNSIKDSGPLETEQKGILLPCYLNAAACHLKRTNFHKAVEMCDKALVLSPGNIKGLYRQGLAHKGLGNTVEATTSLESAMARIDRKVSEEKLDEAETASLQSTRNAIQSELRTLNACARADSLKMRRAWRGLERSKSLDLYGDKDPSESDGWGSFLMNLVFWPYGLAIDAFRRCCRRSKKKYA